MTAADPAQQLCFRHRTCSVAQLAAGKPDVKKGIEPCLQHADMPGDNSEINIPFGNQNARCPAKYMLTQSGPKAKIIRHQLLHTLKMAEACSKRLYHPAKLSHRVLRAPHPFLLQYVATSLSLPWASLHLSGDTGG